MRFKGIVIIFLASLSILGSCAEESCPVAMKSDLQYFKKGKYKPKSKSKSKKRPTPSLIHITRVTYKPSANH